MINIKLWHRMIYLMFRVNKWIKRHGNVTVIKPTCRHYGEGSLPFDAHPNIKLVPYSDHSSFSELKHFVQCVRPRCIKPSVSLCHMEMSYFNELLDLTAMVCCYNSDHVMLCDPIDPVHYTSAYQDNVHMYGIM